jgi:hypothetical protein
MMSRRALAPGLALAGLVVLLAGGAVITGDRGTPSASSTTTPGGTSASASEDPHALTVADVTRSLQENAGFMPLANFENLRITISPSGDEVDLDARPNLVLDEHSFLLQAGSDALVAAKAIIGWYPTVLQVGVTLEGTFRDAGGGSSVQPGVSVALSGATVLGWSSGAVAEPDPSTVVCYADAYTINPAIWNVLSAADRGCLAAPTG